MFADFYFCTFTFLNEENNIFPCFQLYFACYINMSLIIQLWSWDILSSICLLYMILERDIRPSPLSNISMSLWKAVFEKRILWCFFCFLCLYCFILSCGCCFSCFILYITFQLKARSLLQAGYVGEDVESILYKLLTVYFLCCDMLLSMFSTSGC